MHALAADLRTAKQVRGNASTYAAFAGSEASFRGYLNEEFNQLIVELAKKHDWRPLSLGPRPGTIAASNDAASIEGSWDSIERQLVTEHDRPPETLLFPIKFHWNYDELAQLGPHLDNHMPQSNIIVLVDDLHWFMSETFKVQHRALSMADLVMATYAHTIHLLYLGNGQKNVPGLRRPQKLVWLPHATTAQYFMSLRDPDLICDHVLLSGATTRDWYPYRHMVQRWITRTIDPRFALLDHPGYAHFRGNPFVGRGFASQLNKYAACVTDGLHLNYTIAKVFEIPAAGCLLLINAEMRPHMARLGLFDGVHFLTYSDASTLTDLVDQVLDPQNSRMIQVMRRRAQLLVLWRHIVTRRAAEVHTTWQLFR